MRARCFIKVFVRAGEAQERVHGTGYIEASMVLGREGCKIFSFGVSICLAFWDFVCLLFLRVRVNFEGEGTTRALMSQGEKGSVRVVYSFHVL